MHFIGMAAVTLDWKNMCYYWPMTITPHVVAVFFMWVVVAIASRYVFQKQYQLQYSH